MNLDLERIPGFDVRTGWPEELDGDVRGWHERVLGADLPPGARVTIVRVEDAISAGGWPLTVIAAEIRAGGRPFEARLAAFYTVLDQGIAALVRAAPGARWDDPALAALTRAHLVADEPAGISDLLARP